jgi:hypothetical protein
MERRFPACFLSCSFEPDDRLVVSWFERVLLAFEFDPKKGDDPQPRPPPEKIAELIQSCECLVAVVTRRTKLEDEDAWIGPEWIQNEIGMAYQAKKPIAVFVEEGVDVKGLGRWATDYVSFSRTDIGSSAPNIIRYLTNLRRAVIRTETLKGDDLPTARALLNELAGFAALVDSVDKPRYLPWQMAFVTSRSTGRFYMLPSEVQEHVSAAYAAIDDFEELVKPSSILRKPAMFPTDKVEAIKAAKQRVSNALITPILELLRYAYPEAWNALVDAFRKGGLPGGTGDAPPGTT